MVLFFSKKKDIHLYDNKNIPYKCPQQLWEKVDISGLKGWFLLAFVWKWSHFKVFYSLLCFTLLVVHNENLMSLQKNTKRTPRFDFLYSHWRFWGEFIYLLNGRKRGFIPQFLENPFLHSFCQIFGIFIHLLIFNKVNHKGINRFIFGKQVNLALK